MKKISPEHEKNIDLILESKCEEIKNIAQDYGDRSNYCAYLFLPTKKGAVDEYQKIINTKKAFKIPYLGIFATLILSYFWYHIYQIYNTTGFAWYNKQFLYLCVVTFIYMILGIRHVALRKEPKNWRSIQEKMNYFRYFHGIMFTNTGPVCIFKHHPDHDWTVKKLKSEYLEHIAFVKKKTQENGAELLVHYSDKLDNSGAITLICENESSEEILKTMGKDMSDFFKAVKRQNNPAVGFDFKVFENYCNTKRL